MLECLQLLLLLLVWCDYKCTLLLLARFGHNRLLYRHLMLLLLFLFLHLHQQPAQCLGNFRLYLLMTVRTHSISTPTPVIQHLIRTRLFADVIMTKPALVTELAGAPLVELACDEFACWLSCVWVGALAAFAAPAQLPEPAGRLLCDAEPQLTCSINRTLAQRRAQRRAERHQQVAVVVQVCKWQTRSKPVLARQHQQGYCCYQYGATVELISFWPMICSRWSELLILSHLDASLVSPHLLLFASLVVLLLPLLDLGIQPLSTATTT